MKYPHHIIASAKQQQDWEYNRLLTQRGFPAETINISIQKPSLDADALAFSLRMLVQRHESLRTSFKEEKGIVYQCIHPYNKDDVALLHVDWSRQQKSILSYEDFFQQAKDSCCDLVTYPLIRSFYVISPGADKLFVLILPHILCDAHSIRLIKQELTLFYKWKLHPGNPMPKAGVPVQLQEYTAHRTARHIVNSRTDTQFWQKTLTRNSPGFEPSCSTDVFEARIQKSESTHMNVIIGDGILPMLRHLAARTHVSLGTVLYTAYLLAYSSFSGKNDVLLASPVTDRSRPGYDQIIGNLMGGTYLPLSLSPYESVSQLLQKVSLSYLLATRHIIFRHSDAGLDESELRNRCDLYCNLELDPVGEQVFDNFVPGHYPSGTQYYKLTAMILIHEELILHQWRYHGSFYSRAAMEELAHVHATVLRQLAGCNPDKKLCDPEEMPLTCP